VEEEADPEGEAAGRRHGPRLGWEKKKGGRKKKGPAAPGLLSEAAWRDSLATSAIAGARPADVAPESRQGMWRDSMRSRATRPGATKRATFCNFSWARVIFNKLD
jgi:hypothetical protein